MLAGLRHDGFVGRNDQHHHVDAAHAGKHVLDESLVTGHVDEADGRLSIEREIGESDIDRDAALLLFLEPVGINAGERLHERGLAVIDVSCGSYDNVRHNSS